MPNGRTLHDVAADMRRLATTGGGMPRWIDRATLGGRMLLEAIELGGFCSPEHAGWVTTARAAAAGELSHQTIPPGQRDGNTMSPAGPWHALVNGYSAWLIERGEHAGATWGPELVAAALRELAGVLDAGRARDDAGGPTGVTTDPAGMTVGALAAALRMSEETVGARMHELHIPRPKRGERGTIVPIADCRRVAELVTRKGQASHRTAAAELLKSI